MTAQNWDQEAARRLTRSLTVATAALQDTVNDLACIALLSMFDPDLPTDVQSAAGTIALAARVVRAKYEGKDRTDD